MIDAQVVADLRRSFAAALDRDDPVEARNGLLTAGWLEALDADQPIAVALAFRLQGGRLRDAAILDDVIAGRLARLWPEASGDLAVAYPAMSSAAGPRAITHVVLPGHRQARRLLWLENLRGEKLEILELELQLEPTPGAGLDPDLGLLGLSRRPAGRSIKFPGPEPSALWEEALAAGRVALSHQIVAGSRTMLDLATAYARVRTQFGTPIGAFQAIKHRLAETLVAVESADAAAVAAATTQSASGAAIAKVLAGWAAASAARNCLQVFGGVGFTADHDFHRYFRRNLVAERLLGDARTIERQLGRDVRTRRLAGYRVVELTDPLRMELLEPLSSRASD
jgi:Acyl-CoA dehydrogenase, C-terminal domain